MIFSKRKLIFIHIPKTGGNFATLALSKYSDDHIVTSGHQDGKDRFELRGDVTRHKHQGLADYAAAMGGNLFGRTVAAVARPPLPRLASLYYSPHRWLRPTEEGEHRFDPTINESSPDMVEFQDLVESVPSMSELIDADRLSGCPRLNKSVQHQSGARLILIDFAGLKDGLAALAREFGMPEPDFAKSAVNSSAAATKRDRLTHDISEAANIVRKSKHARDMQIFAKNRVSSWLVAMAYTMRRG